MLSPLFSQEFSDTPPSLKMVSGMLSWVANCIQACSASSRSRPLAVDVLHSELQAGTRAAEGARAVQLAPTVLEYAGCSSEPGCICQAVAQVKHLPWRATPM